ncbi:MAG: hypothetical protein LBV36_04310 [Chromatiales bacterium]|jgi:hypothetical protein|nr:hypothetical protein [Chromatiales bacterium]
MRWPTPALIAGVVLALWNTCVSAASPISDIANTRHNFSAVVKPSNVERRAEAASESQICAFCHTPHGATPAPNAPLWNRKLSQATYIPYSSTSLDATDLDQPSGRSKLCLSCHDGTIALGAVNVLNRQQLKDNGSTVPFTFSDKANSVPKGTIPQGQQGRLSGFTRYIGVDLTNDHPISFTFDSAQAARDGELFDSNSVPWLGERTRRIDGEAQQPFPRGHYLPLERDAEGVGPKVECISCHDPHVRSQVPGENVKFLRVNRFQQQPPVQGQFDAQRDIICLGCHDKAGWAGSAHANPAVGDERYTDAAAELREFPLGTRVWQAACLNCHDPHTVQGARRILREGVDGPLDADPVTGTLFHRGGGNPAVEQVCYACHGDPAVSGPGSPATAQTLQGQIRPNDNPAFEVPDVKTDFVTMRTHMPIASVDQLAGQEVHSIGTGDAATQGTARGKDFIESRELLGLGNPNNRHAECTDCHNPHRVQRTRVFNDDPTVPAPGPTHDRTPGVPPTNLASGVLRGIWGVEPVYANTAFGSNPVNFQVKRGDPGIGGSTDASAPYLTREYQLCFKCHSNYAYDIPPPLGYTSGLTPSGTNSLFNYTNQAMEFQPPLDHQGETTPGTPTGAYVGAPATGPVTPRTDSSGTGSVIWSRLDPEGNLVDYVTNNHRSWHPTVQPTGRTPAVRGADGNAWRPPFNTSVGTQTMYCTDCHGSRTAGNTIVPVGGEQGYPWGPHGSDENFLLKGNWSDQTGEAATNFANEADPTNHLCFRCHDPKNYVRGVAEPNPQVVRSGFRRAIGGGGCLQFLGTNLHIGHAAVVNNFRCTYCHIAIPHGWKNKVFLANLNDVGLEAELPPGTQVRYTGFAPSGAGRYYKGPYYLGTVLKVRSFARSGEWLDVNCGSAGGRANNQPGGNGIVGVNWMNNSSESCLNPP